MTEWNIEVEHKYIGKYTVEAETLEDAEEVANGLFFDDLLDNRSTTNKLKETIRIEEYVDA